MGDVIPTNCTTITTQTNKQTITLHHQIHKSVTFIQHQTTPSLSTMSHTGTRLRWSTEKATKWTGGSKKQYTLEKNKTSLWTNKSSYNSLISITNCSLQRHLVANGSQPHHSEEGNSCCSNVNNYIIKVVLLVFWWTFYKFGGHRLRDLRNCVLKKKKETWAAKQWPLLTIVRAAIIILICTITSHYAYNNKWKQKWTLFIIATTSSLLIMVNAFKIYHSQSAHVATLICLQVIVNIPCNLLNSTRLAIFQPCHKKQYCTSPSKYSCTACFFYITNVKFLSKLSLTTSPHIPVMLPTFIQQILLLSRSLLFRPQLAYR